MNTRDARQTRSESNLAIGFMNILRQKKIGERNEIEDFVDSSHSRHRRACRIRAPAAQEAVMSEASVASEEAMRESSMAPAKLSSEF
jgi:hypothetical protein